MYNKLQKIVIFLIKIFESNKQKQIIKRFSKILVYFKKLNYILHTGLEQLILLFHTKDSVILKIFLQYIVNRSLIFLQ